MSTDGSVSRWSRSEIKSIDGGALTAAPVGARAARIFAILER